MSWFVIGQMSDKVVVVNGDLPQPPGQKVTQLNTEAGAKYKHYFANIFAKFSANLRTMWRPGYKSSDQKYF